MPTGPSDKELIKRLKSNDNGVLAIIRDCYITQLSAKALNMLHNCQAEAEDAVQETFIDFWFQRQRLKENTNIQAYLFDILKKTCIDELRRKKVRNNFIAEQLPSASLVFICTLESTELNNILATKIELLPFVERTTFVNYYMHKKRQKDIAAIREVNLQSVKNDVSRALKKLREILKNYR